MSDNNEYSLRAPFAHPANWKVRKLRDVCSKIGSGATPTGGQANYLPSRENWALVRSQNVFDRRFDETGLAYITDEQAATLGGVVLQAEDVLLNITGDGVTFARSCQIPDSALPAVVNQHVSIIRPKPELLNPGFLLAYLTHPETKHYIEGFNAGGSRRAITKGHIESFNIPLPPLQVQQDIAHILGTLDDKIELNRRTNETLEAMARAIFKSWFVDFDPVRAKASGEPPESICRRLGLAPDVLALFPESFQDSEFGEIPQGWGFQQAGSVADVGIGKTPPRKETEWFSENPDDMRWVSIRDLGLSGTFVHATRERLTHEAVSRFNIRLVPDYTVLLSFKLTIGRVAITDGAMTTNEAIAHFNLPSSPQITTEYLYWYLQQFDYSKLGSTSSIAEAVNSRMIRNLPVLVPSRQLAKAFTLFVRDLFRQQRELNREVAVLEEMQCTLLRELLSGSVQLPFNEASEVR